MNERQRHRAPKDDPSADGVCGSRRQRAGVWQDALADDMRANPTGAEARLWSRLKRVRGWHRQTPVHGYIADFYHAKGRLVVEVDGPVHAGQRARDRARDRHLAERGIHTIRVSNSMVELYLDAVVKQAESVAIRRAAERKRAAANGNRMRRRREDFDRGYQ